MEMARKNSDPTRYLDTIIRLRHEHDSPKLDSLIKLREPSANSFLIKLEIKKLAQVTGRVIDMRDMFKDNCVLVEHDGISHYLDKPSSHDFLEEMARYNNKYTMGVYNYVIDKAKTRYRNDAGKRSTNNLPPPEITSLTHFYQRLEERIYYSVKIHVFDNNPSIITASELKNTGIAGITTDISAEGLSVKIPNGSLSSNTKRINIWFNGLEQEFSFSNRLLITYDVLKFEPKEEDCYFRLKLSPVQMMDNIDEYKEFIANYIANQKRRYRVPVENTIEALNVKANEQFVITRLNSLPLFLSKNDGEWLARARFDTDNNAKISSFLRDKSGSSLIPAFFNMTHLQSDLDSSVMFTQFYYVIKFKSIKNVIHMASIPLQYVQDNPYVLNLLSHANNRNGLRLYRVDGCSIDPSNEFHVPSSLPDSAGEAFENLNQKPIKRARLLANGLTRMCQITDISDSISALDIMPNEDKSTKNPNETKNTNLGSFVLRMPKKVFRIHSVKAETNDVRIEDRFDYSLQVSIVSRTKKTISPIEGVTKNISTQGLMIKVDQDSQFKIGNEILIDFNSIPGISETGLSRQIYKVVGYDSKGFLRAVIYGDPAKHDARTLLRKFIYKNINTLVPSGMNNEIYGFSRVLRNLFSHNHALPYMLMNKEKNTQYVRDIAISKKTVIPNLSDKLCNEELLSELMIQEQFRSLLIKHGSMIDKETPYQTFYVFILAKGKGDGSSNIIVREGDLLDKDKFRAMFDNMKQIGKPRILRVNITKRGRIFNKYLKDELSYLSKYASPKARECLQTWKSVSGIINLMDVTHLFK